MRRVLENVGPHEVHEVGQGVLTTEPVYTQGHVLDGRTSSLSVHQISAQQREGKKGFTNWRLVKFKFLVGLKDPMFSLTVCLITKYSGVSI